MNKNKFNNDFLKRIVVDYKNYNESHKVPSIEPDMVVEFKLGKKYVYKLNEAHSDYEGISKCQNKLITEFLSNIPISTVAKAYVSGKSYLDFLEPHRNNYYFVRMDLKNFFHSISSELIRNSFDLYFENEFTNEDKKQTLMDAFINIATYKLDQESKNVAFSGKRILPMGFKSSPIISNIIFRKIDILIEDFCSNHNITYTRYADDLLFSSKTNSDPYGSVFLKRFNSKPRTGFIHSNRFLDEISYLVRIDGFKINASKTIKAINTLSLNGYTIEGSNYSDLQGTIRISNKKTQIISKLIFEVKKGSSNFNVMKKIFDFKVSNKYFNYIPPKEEHIERYCRDQIINKVSGYRSYLISILKYESEYKCIDEKSINKYNKLIKELEWILTKPEFAS
ncbi:hypothetical protein A6D98_04020 [Aliivibrio fischeri]|uniref:reverse transcriptase family protein n=1 Tax=Aliivibrio fischeri TaxID=668 RepID=UPI00080DEF2D|nr:reverse transcriptase family protein [Aliivibrio fischeri]OCH62917.1 hypothetical protein A6D98_04020 [Aliivibrio fischeri]